MSRAAQLVTPPRSSAAKGGKCLDSCMCAVCGEFDEPGGDAVDPLVACGTCGLWAHAFCIGTMHLAAPDSVLAAAASGKGSSASGKKRKLEQIVEASADDLEPAAVTQARVSWARKHPQEAFTCHLCAAGFAEDEAPTCALCGASEDNRAMAMVTDQDGNGLDAMRRPVAVSRLRRDAQWAHITCVLWTPGAFFWRPAAFDRVGGLELVDAKRWKLNCALCVAARGSSAGAPLQCSHTGCKVPFHVLCSRAAGWEVNSMQYEGGVVLQTFCGAHSSKSYLRATAAHDAACEACGSADNDAQLILCDGCDGGYHTYCLEPKLSEVPDGAWYCPPCAVKRTGLCVDAEESQEKTDALLLVQDMSDEAEANDDVAEPAGRGVRIRKALLNACFDNSRRHDVLQLLDEEPPKIEACPDLETVIPKAVEIRAAAVAASAMRNLYAASYGTLVLTGAGDVFAAAIAAEAARGADTFMIADAAAETDVPHDIRSVIVVNIQHCTNTTWLARLASRPERRVIVPCTDLQAGQEALRLLQSQRVLLHFTVPGFFLAGNVAELAHFRHGRSSAADGVVGPENVLKSLTPNHRSILRFLCTLSSGSGDSGVRFPALLQRCKQDLLVSTAAALQQHLTEFIDHSIVEMKGDLLRLLHPPSDLLALLESMK